MTGSPIALRAATINDLDFAWQLYCQTMRYVTDQLPDFDEARHMAAFAERFVPQEVRIIVSGNQDIGWLQVSETEDEIFIKQMFLRPASQRQGIGSILLVDVIERGRLTKKPVRLGVVKVNPALRLYQRHGFTITSEPPVMPRQSKLPKQLQPMLATRWRTILLIGAAVGPSAAKGSSAHQLPPGATSATPMMV